MNIHKINEEYLTDPLAFALAKGITLEWTYRLMRMGIITQRIVSGKHYIIYNENARNWQRKRAKSVKKQVWK